MPATLSRAFMNGSSQAVRIPQALRLETSRVENFRNADGDLVLRPVPAERGSGKPNVLRRLDARAFERVAGLRLENWAENSAPPPPVD